MIFFYIPYAYFKLYLDCIVSLRLPKEYLNFHNCSFDINIVKFLQYDLYPLEPKRLLLGLKENAYPSN